MAGAVIDFAKYLGPIYTPLIWRLPGDTRPDLRTVPVTITYYNQPTDRMTFTELQLSSTR